MADAQGIDVSHWQPSVNWPEVALSKQFALCRIANGITPDETFKGHWQAINAARLIRGCYQYYRYNQPIREQARLLLDTLGGYTTGDIPPVLDVEDPEITDTARAVDGIRQWVELVRDALKVQPIIYTNYAWGSRLNLPAFDCPLWAANYTAAAKPLLPPGWKDWRFWQFTDKGDAANLKVDLDRYNGTIDELRTWLASLAPDLPPPVEPAPEPPQRITGQPTGDPKPPAFWIELPDGTLFDVPGDSVTLKIHRKLPPIGGK